MQAPALRGLRSPRPCPVPLQQPHQPPKSRGSGQPL